MSTTVLQLITGACQICNIIDETQSPSASMSAEAVWVLNNMLANWAADGVDLGWYDASSSSLTATCPLQEADNDAVELCLAGRLAARKGIQLSAQTLALIESEYAKLVKRTRAWPEANLSELPSPQGPFGGNRNGYW